MDDNKTASTFFIKLDFAKREKYKIIGTLSEMINARNLKDKISFEDNNKLATK